MINDKVEESFLNLKKSIFELKEVISSSRATLSETEKLTCRELQPDPYGHLKAYLQWQFFLLW